MVEGGVKMKGMWKEIVSSVIAVVGLVVVFARLESYNWWLIGSWKGALGVIAVLGLVVFAINAVEMFRFEAWPSFIETFMWVIAATFVVASLFTKTTRDEFITSAVLIAFAGLTHMLYHFVDTGHKHKTQHYLPVH
jgi:hypothetical protein